MWINFFIESCRSNRGIDWIVFNDVPPPDNRARNVRHVRVGFNDYNTLVSEALGIRFAPADPYKICDIRPALPYVHRKLLEGYDFVGFGDLDVIYGDILSFYDEATLSRYDLLSSHPTRVSGHFCVMRNTPEMVEAFKEIRGWESAFARQDHIGFDERDFYKLLRGRRSLLPRRSPARSCLFREAYSTPGAARSMRWCWKDGQLTNEFYPQHPFMYLHLMNWHSNRWFAHQGVAADAPPPWKLIAQVVHTDWRDARTDGFMISQNGIEAIPQSRTA